MSRRTIFRTFIAAREITLRSTVARCLSGLLVLMFVPLVLAAGEAAPDPTGWWPPFGPRQDWIAKPLSPASGEQLVFVHEPETNGVIERFFAACKKFIAQANADPEQMISPLWPRVELDPNEEELRVPA